MASTAVPGKKRVMYRLVQTNNSFVAVPVDDSTSGGGVNVKIEPSLKVKVEPPAAEEEEQLVPCPLCTKGFYNEVALRNHARAHHCVELTPDQLKQKTSAPAPAAQSPTVVTRRLVVPTPKIVMKTMVKREEPETEEEEVIWTPDMHADNVSKPEPADMVEADYDADTNDAPEVEAEVVESSDGTEEQTHNMSARNASKMLSLASEDISYIIVKSDEGGYNVSAKRKARREKEPGEERVKRNYTKPSKESISLNGPFECLQPSNAIENAVCHQIFFNCCDYSLHYGEEHTKRKKAGLRCQVCEKRIDENNDGDYFCGSCGKCFETKELLDSHVAANHVKIKPYQCSVCNKRFAQAGNVQQHMRLHSGIRPYPCSQCNKAFTQKSGLDQHMRTHTKLKPFVCVICQKSFAQTIHLRQHMRTHTNIHPFQCDVCHKKFKQSSHLNFHMKVHSGEGGGGGGGGGGRGGASRGEQEESEGERDGDVSADNTDEIRQQVMILEQDAQEATEVTVDNQEQIYVISEGQSEDGSVYVLASPELI